MFCFKNLILFKFSAVFLFVRLILFMCAFYLHVQMAKKHLISSLSLFRQDRFCWKISDINIRHTSFYNKKVKGIQLLWILKKYYCNFSWHFVFLRVFFAYTWQICVILLQPPRFAELQFNFCKFYQNIFLHMIFLIVKINHYWDKI